jgi:hypothetical protein
LAPALNSARHSARNNAPARLRMLRTQAVPFQIPFGANVSYCDCVTDCVPVGEPRRDV